MKRIVLVLPFAAAIALGGPAGAQGLDANGGLRTGAAGQAPPGSRIGAGSSLESRGVPKSLDRSVSDENRERVQDALRPRSPLEPKPDDGLPPPAAGVPRSTNEEKR